MAVTGGTVDMKTAVGFPFPQGCTVEGQTANFSVAVPEGQTCELIIYKKGARTSAFSQKMPYSDVAGNLHFLSVVLEQPEDYEYCYKIGGKIVPDPYGKAFSGREHWSVSKGKEKRKLRTRIVTDTFDWEKSQFPHLNKEDVIAYSLHVRGFTKHSSSGVAHKGTFDGVTEKLPYLQKLGINQIHLMPVYEFDENQRHVNYWGYGKAYFFAPKASYAAGDPVNEMKSLVRQMHLAGIEVILEMPFTEGTTFSLILDCLRYWVMQYHVDGFIVNPYICNPDELAKDPVLAKSKILKKEDGFQNVMRRFLKGDEGMIRDVICQLKNQDTQLYNYIASHNGFTLCDVVSYDGKHNEANGENNLDGPDYNYSWNCGAEGNSRKKAVNELRKNQIFNAFFLLLFAQGMPCILSGDEFMNTQKGNNNAYCQDNLISWLDWNQLSRQEELYTFVCRLIALRKACMKQIAKKSEDTMGRSGIPQISYHGEDAWQMPAGRASRQLGVFYHEECTEKDFYIAYNMHWLSHSFALPSLPKGMEWVCIAGTKEGVLDEKEAVPVKDKKVQLEERTIKVFVGRQAKE
ncbi:Glycogen debranching enzyme [Allocoprococcus comes]|uniref:Glycogen operon protein GlgX homolog n=1 Tax=Coprococcus comes TaxID=410072 RepID=A0AA37VHG4_9FIRM|nr:alpha-amylase family glycosyl hydrolase [Coprococcus comes]GLG86939.1 glycogen operon protein GlgX homolog [Coprococcus comes]CUN65454.1 Glycogen debranching enzyme [Coprococcus comes]